MPYECYHRGENDTPMLEKQVQKERRKGGRENEVGEGGNEILLHRKCWLLI